MQPVPEKLRGPKTEWNWATYFETKKQKLEAQFDKNREELDEQVDPITKVLFKNISIFVNGYTNPTAIELKYLMLKHGGYYYEYLNDHITHIIATNLAYSKALVLKSKLVVKPEWITDSIKEKKLLPTDPYLVIPNTKDKNQNKLTEYISKEDGYIKQLLVQKTPKPNLNLKSTVSAASRKKLHQAKSRQICVTEIKSNESSYTQEYECFQARINNFELPDNVNKKQSVKELEIEKIKHLLDDWIFWTSKTNKLKSASKYQQQIDSEDLEIFKGYLLYILNKNKDLEKLMLILKLLKRLVIKNGSMEWVDSYKEIYSSIQADFYSIYDSTFNLE